VRRRLRRPAEAGSKPAPTAAAAPAPTPSAAAAAPPKNEPSRSSRRSSWPIAQGPNVTFEQKAVEDEVRRKLPKPTGDITIADLKKLKSFNMSQVKGLEELDVCIFSHMTGLKELFLGEVPSTT